MARKAPIQDRVGSIVLNGLRRALVNPDGLPLHGTKAEQTLFGSGAQARQSAAWCKQSGYLHALRTEARGKRTVEICALSDEGLQFLLGEVDPRTVLTDLGHALKQIRPDVVSLVTAAMHLQGTIDTMASALTHALQREADRSSGSSSVRNDGNNSSSWIESMRSFLADHLARGEPDDCPLPTLFRNALVSRPNLTVGQFHDAVRALYRQNEVYLHPWTGPLHELPEPDMALLVGHEVIYYASYRQGTP